jgi:hypothetical protein
MRPASALVVGLFLSVVVGWTLAATALCVSSSVAVSLF